MRNSTIPASVNTASTVRATQSRNAMLASNTDRLLHVTLPVGAPKGSVIYDQVITPSIAARLRTQASLYQKIRYSRLEFEVQTQTPTTNSGGYVIAFLHDPTMEVGTGETALRSLTAVQGTKTSKFWQSSVLNVQTTSQEYFTLNGQDVRLFSPGRFVVLSDGPPTEAVSITIIFKWTVNLTRPALQRPVARYPQAVLTATGVKLFPGVSSDTSRNALMIYRNWNVTTNTFSPPQPTPNAPGDSYNVENAFSGLPPVSTIGDLVLYYQMPHPVTLEADEVGGETFISIARFVSFRAAGDGHYVAKFHELPSDKFVIVPTSTVATEEGGYMLIQGDRLNPVTADEFAGNADEVFLVSASPSVSVNRQPMISKEFQTLRPYESSRKSNSREAIQDKLSCLRLDE